MEAALEAFLCEKHTFMLNSDIKTSVFKSLFNTQI